MHLNGIGNTIDKEVLTELEKRILEIKTEKIKYFNDTESCQTSSLQEDSSLYEEDNFSSPCKTPDNFDRSKFNSDLFDVKSLPKKQKYVMPPSGSKDE